LQPKCAQGFRIKVLKYFRKKRETENREEAEKARKKRKRSRRGRNMKSGTLPPAYDSSVYLVNGKVLIDAGMNSDLNINK
jgi:hypothetical protein